MCFALFSVRDDRFSREWSRQDGFALILALGLVSFFLVLTVVFTAVVRAELRAAEAGRQRTIAREHARLGLMVALGDLQRHAGPDRRSTGTAALLGAAVDPSHQWTTGVWDLRPGSDPSPVWLVSRPGGSGEPLDISRPYSSGETIELVGRGTLGPDATPGDRVRVPRVPIPAPGSPAMGSYAYWIGDQGVKTSVGKWNRLDALEADGGLSTLEAKRLAQTTPGRMRNEWLFDRWDGTSEWDEWKPLRSTLSRARQLEPLVLMHGLEHNALRSRFHQTTWSAFGVLSNPADGGLKYDLSYQGDSIFADGFMEHPSLREWVTHRLLPGDMATLYGIDADVVDDFDEDIIPVFTRLPVLTEFALYVGFFRTGRWEDTLRAQIAVRGDIWNCHTFPLQFSNGSGADLVMEIEGLPEHQVSWVTAAGTTGEERGTFPVDLESIIFSSDSGENRFRLQQIDLDMHSPMAPGEVRTIVERGEGPIGRSITDDATGTIQDDFIRTAAPPSELTVRLKTADGKLLQEFRSVPVEAFNTEELGHNLVSRSRPTYAEYQFVYHFKYYDEVLNAGSEQLSDLEVWTTKLDPRRVVMDLQVPRVGSMFAIGNPARASIDNTLFMDRPEFFYGGSGTVRRNYHRFFDLPSTPPVSVGSLQHMQFLKRPPYSVGNPWGGKLNHIFDHYYFSSVPQSGFSWDPARYLDPDRPSLGRQPLPNVHLKPIDCPGRPLGLETLRSPLSSANFLVRGAFNIHSMDTESWMALLGGIHLYNWDYRVNETGFQADPLSRAHVKNGVFRHPFGADRHYTHPQQTYPHRYPEISQAEKRAWYKNHWQPDWAAAYTVGMRELRDGNNPDGIHDLRDLASAVVDELETRAVPFRSLEELARSGLLQRAIDRTRINTVDHRNFVEAEDDIFNRFPRNAPSTLSQADLLQMIAPVVQVRSDTFLIRAYGDSINPVTGEVVSRAWCEATVQRLPQPVDWSGAEPDLEDYRSPPGRFGRRFVITDIRWIQGEDV